VVSVVGAKERYFHELLALGNPALICVSLRHYLVSKKNHFWSRFSQVQIFIDHSLSENLLWTFVNNLKIHLVDKYL
jgi:hypothetical protein